MRRSIRAVVSHHAHITVTSAQGRWYASHQAPGRYQWRPVLLSSSGLKPSGAVNEYQTRRWRHSESLDIDGDEQPTIYALSTASGRAAIAVIRISGPACRQIYSSLCPNRPVPKPRHATLRTLYDPSLPPSPSSILDSSTLILYFPGPRTLTGEDILELHVHGGPAIIRAVLAAIPRCLPPLAPDPHSTRLPPIRYASPGEFTRRAFLNDRLSLPQIEALSDTLTATTEQQRRLSVRGAASSNRLAQTYESWRQSLLQARGELEALIDFAEDQQFEETPVRLVGGVVRAVEALRRRMLVHGENAVRGELLRGGISLALLGAPNAGKSSLLNCVVGREAAIVSREAGTTRDVVEVGIDLGGWYVRLGDMAGLRGGETKIGDGRGLNSSDVIGEIEQEGIRRAKEQALKADVVLVVLSLEEPGADVSGHPSLQLDTEVIDTARRCSNVVVAINKIDLHPAKASSPARWVSAVQHELPEVQASRIFEISCRAASTTPPDLASQDPGGIQTLLNGLIDQFKDLTAAIVPDDEAPDSDVSIWQESLGVTERQRGLLEECVMHLDRFLENVLANAKNSEDSVGNIGDDLDVVAAAEDLRAAAECLAKITGKGESGDVEEVLGVVFEK
ncbi:hypothetical protein EV356DRAFT_479459 [Viridothelium virens]|uniref:P-loop containing nucleoside triphosphate hydrolase protein n=1 Tax=Viridothelium virens TaxID=1048519 RepID=A0A6A6HJI1_VIRVR|nr:hypothetical protein EV356DRAFT_479459 [Viridothelium virens]